MQTQHQMTVHASCVSVGGNGLLVFGKSGAGKSTLALQMVDLGADFVSDDRTVVTLGDGKINAASPPAIAGLIEARGVGLLKIESIERAQIVACVDLDHIEIERLPIARVKQLLGQSIPCFHKVESVVFPSALMHYLRGGKVEV